MRRKLKTALALVGLSVVVIIAADLLGRVASAVDDRYFGPPADRLLAMPGLVNGHVHSPGNFLKGATDDAPLEIFMLHEVPPFSDEPP